MTDSNTHLLPRRSPKWWRHLVETTVRQWLADGVPPMAAALAYYLLVTLAPLIVVIVWLIDAAVGFAGGLQTGVLGEPEVAVSGARELVSIADRYFATVGENGTLIAVGIALFGATVFVAAFIKSLDAIFHADRDAVPGWKTQLRRRSLALLTLVVLVAALMLATVVSAVLGAAVQRAEELLLSDVTVPAFLAQTLDVVSWVSAAVLLLLISFAFTYLPQRRIRWRDSLPGALLTTAAFLIGQRVLGIYLESSSLISAFGAMSAFLAFLIWAYYTMQVVLSGAVFTQVWATDAEARREPTGKPESPTQSPSSGEDA